MTPWWLEAVIAPTVLLACIGAAFFGPSVLEFASAFVREFRAEFHRRRQARQTADQAATAMYRVIAGRDQEFQAQALNKLVEEVVKAYAPDAVLVPKDKATSPETLRLIREAKAGVWH